LQVTIAVFVIVVKKQTGKEEAGFTSGSQESHRNFKQIREE